MAATVFPMHADYVTQHCGCLVDLLGKLSYDWPAAEKTLNSPRENETVG